jgi:predicted DNA-binding transcriptional regulator AlpA
MNVLDEPLLSDIETAAILGVAPKTLPAWRHYGKGPPYVKVGKRVRYNPSKIREWLNMQIIEPSRKAAAA